MPLKRLITNICSNKLDESKAFYVRLFNLEVAYESDWYIQLHSPGHQELGIIKADHELIPPSFQKEAQGVYLTFEVDDVDATYEKANGAGYDIVQAPEDTFYGQRRLLMTDPNGLLLDISSPIPGFKIP